MLEPYVVEQLLAAARDAREHAYARYSGFAVGAAVLTTGGQIHNGCNVENASYGLSLCAERNAVAAAVAQGMRPGQLLALAVVGEAQTPIAPCGACLQVLAEFAAADCEVYTPATEGSVQVRRLTELLPQAFRIPPVLR